jgi:hypothetical protein
MGIHSADGGLRALTRAGSVISLAESAHPTYHAVLLTQVYSIEGSSCQHRGTQKPRPLPHLR